VNGSSSGESVRQAFFEWAGAGAGAVDISYAHTDNVLRIDFERGAIDAQESINGGILVVVTGHMFLPGSSKEDAFVHTFFLNNAALPGRKKQFLVKNDVLRFLEPAVVAEVKEMEEVAEVPASMIDQQPALVVESVTSVATVQETTLVSSPVIKSSPLVLPVEYEPSADEEKAEEDNVIEEPMIISQLSIPEVDPAAEEEKVDVTEISSGGSDASPTTTPTSAADSKKSKRNHKKRGGKSRSRSNSPRKEGETKAESRGKPKTPGSWASLVASSSGPTNNTVNDSKGGRRVSPKGSRSGHTEKSSSSNSSNQDISAKAPPQSQPEKEPTVAVAACASVTTTPQPQSIQTQRSPEATLFIRNIPDKTTEPQIRNLFESHGVATGNTILGITLNPNRGFCFVDFDGPAAVMAIVNESNSSLIKDQRTGRKVESSFMVHGRVLDVEKKVKSDRHKASSGGSGGGRRYNRSHSPKDGGGRYRGSRGGGAGGMRRSPPQGGGGVH